MPLKINAQLSAKELLPSIARLFELSAQKLLSLDRSWNPAHGAPVYTVRGQYRTRGWTDWTQGFQAGSALLQFDATGQEQFLELGRRATRGQMATHLSHTGVHDHGFNNISTYGNLWRLMREGKLPSNDWESEFYQLALKVSGAVQAARWTPLAGDEGYIYSFNGPHSLFVDTLRSLRSLAVSHQLGHVLMGERDRKISLLQRLLVHAATTARYSVYYGEGRDIYDVPGRVAQESIFNLNDGSYRCPSTQQGYSPFSTWTRGLSWTLLGYAEELEFLQTLSAEEIQAAAVKEPGLARPADPQALFLRAARITAEFYLANTCADGIPMWDTAAPNLHRLGDYADRPADPFNPWEPVDSSAAAIAAQGLLRLGNYLSGRGERGPAARYRNAGLTVASTLLDEPYLSKRRGHQGLLLHSVYHRPNGWDASPRGRKIPNGESSMWGDYHLRELAVLLQREAKSGAYPTFFAPTG